MKCQQCEKPATFHITELTSGKPQEVHLCESCARNYLTETPSEEVEPAVGNLSGMLAQQMAVGETAEELARLERKACQKKLEFRKEGRLGCANDYSFFADELDPLIVNIHGETLHVGKVPKRAAGDQKTQTELIRLRRELKEAVQREEYERASELRDAIKALEEAEENAPAPKPQNSTEE
ncbi:MAG: UvrB/UvrC motif-containing protein [Planctomycetales bacterium]|nr:UvrB/UvrC motif-containing protein [Planctomycetales bacterium]